MFKKIQILMLTFLLILFLIGCSVENVETQKNILETEKIVEKTSNYNLEDLDYKMTTDTGCFNDCGNGICDTLQCLSHNCTCEETEFNCAIDCK